MGAGLLFDDRAKVDDARLRLGAYEVLFELSAGGMATVYLARKAGAAGFERLVVLKRIHRHLLGDRDLCDMLRDEAKIASLIVHPNVVGVDDVIEHGGELILAQPYVESVALSALLRAARAAGERLPPAVVVRIACDVLAGLHAAHEARDLMGEPLHVVHRDVSPHNVLVGADGVSRLIDFGIAKARRRITQTESGVMKGKIGYMAPEVLRRAEVDRRADLFAAGVTIHEALTGKKPFDGADEADVLLAIVMAEPDPPSAVEPTLPIALDEPVLRALARRPDDRVATAAELSDSLMRAVAPASPREVAALVERLTGPSLAAVRARVHAALKPASAEAEQGLTGQDPIGPGSPGPGALESGQAITETRPVAITSARIAAPARGSLFWPLFSALLVGLLAGILVLLLRNPSVDMAPSNATQPPPPASAVLPAASAASPIASSSNQEVTAKDPSGQASSTPTVAATSAAASARGPVPKPSVAPRPSASVSAAPTSELHQNPYGGP